MDYKIIIQYGGNSIVVQQFGSICQAQKCLQRNPEPFQQAVMNFLKIPI